MELSYRPNVCILLFNRDHKLLLGERFNNPGVFQFPQGGVEEGSLEDNVYREIQEELGIERKHVEIRKRLITTHQYDFAQVPEYAVGKWRGQAQTFWLVAFLGADTDINIATEHPEFMSYRWCDLSEIALVAEKRRLPGYEAPIREAAEEFSK